MNIGILIRIGCLCESTVLIKVATMIYYSETGELLPAEEIDMEKGYLVDLETVHREAEHHTASKTLPGGVVLTWQQLDKP